MRLKICNNLRTLCLNLKYSDWSVKFEFMVRIEILDKTIKIIALGLGCSFAHSIETIRDVTVLYKAPKLFKFF